MRTHQSIMTEHHQNPIPDTSYDLEAIKGALKRIVIGVDPAVTSGQNSNETGIVVAGLCYRDVGYVLEDASLRAPATEWAAQIVAVYKKWDADRVVAETNQGGDLVETMLRVVAPLMSYRGVKATRGKRLRAEPVAALYEQKRVLHLHQFPELEKQMCNFQGRSSDVTDRLDALVWALTDLMVDARDLDHERRCRGAF